MRKLAPDEIEKIKLARALEPLRRLEAWRIYKDLLLAHKENHIKAIMSGTADVAGVLKGERDKGAVVALNLATGLLDILCKEAEDLTKGREDDASD